MYPLNLTKAATGNTPAGFALANDEAEHASLSEAGYLPSFIPPAEPTHDDDEHSDEERNLRDALIVRAADLGITVDGRWSDKRLAAEVANAEQA